MAANTQRSGGPSGNRSRITVWGSAAFLLLLPFLGMQFTSEMNWDETDLVIFGAMLVAACGSYELVARMARNVAYRAAVGVAIVAAILLVWINLAVGIVGSEDNPANLMYGGVLAIGIIGSFMTRFQSRGMMHSLMGMAVAQVSVAVVALVFGWGSSGANWPHVIIVLNGFFAALWLGSAGLFWKAARDQALTASAA